jgi:hypothetical protein
LATLLAAHEAIRNGARRVLFVVGDAGIGKSALIVKYCDEIGSVGAALVVRGSCIDAYGAREPYLPVLTTLTRLGGGPHADVVLRGLERVAPAWAALLPSLFSLEQLNGFARRANTVGQELMLLQFAQLIELLAHERPLVWCLEDLHWADRSTLELVAYVGRADLRHFMLLASARIAYAEASLLISDLVADRSQLGVCEKLVVLPFSRDHVHRYLEARFEPQALPEALSDLIHQRTCGTPLFVVQWADALVDKRLIAAPEGKWTLLASLAEAGASVPSTTAQTIEMQVDRLSKRERSILEAACVAGTRFGVLALADVLDEDCVELERVCLDWANHERFLRVAGEAEWPDGTRTTLFSFSHSLYQEVLYKRLGAAHRARLHQRLAKRMESAYGRNVVHIAAELATHFEQSGDHTSAARYLLLAGNTALTRFAYASAEELLRRGLRELSLTEPSPAKLCLELDLYSALGSVQGTRLGHWASDARTTYRRVRELAEELEHTPLDAVFGSWMTLFMRGDYAAANEFASRISARAIQAGDVVFVAAAETMVGLSAFFLGHLVEGRQLLESALGVLAFDRRSLPTNGQLDPAFIAYNLMWAHWISGRADQARTLADRSLATPGLRERHVGATYLLDFASVVYEECGDHERATAIVESTPFPQEVGFFFRRLVDWQLDVQKMYLDGVPSTRKLAEQFRGMLESGIGVAVTRPPSIVALAGLREGLLSEATEALRLAFDLLVSKQERWWEAELHRLHGELWLALDAKGMTAVGCDRGTSGADSPEACFQRALEVAQAQRALSFELRAAMSLARLWDAQGRREPARKLLEDTYGAFTEGFDTRDLVAARELLERFARRPQPSPS